MSFPLRPKRASGAADAGEPHFAGAAARLPSAARPATEPERAAPLRFPAEARREFPAESPPRLTLSAADRLVISSPSASPAEVRRRPGMLRTMGFIVLLVLASIGTVSVYQALAAYLPLPVLH